ncbi:hypothetical protein PSHT_07919, partial [Puccinia striiformis]
KQTTSKEHDLIQSPYHLDIPEIFKKYIQEIFNPKGNGNCGYRCLAKVLGCAAFLPTRMSPKDNISISELVYLLHEFIGLKPMPPVVEPSRVTSQITKEWKSHFNSDLTLYNQEVKRGLI